MIQRKHNNNKDKSNEEKNQLIKYISIICM